VNVAAQRRHLALELFEVEVEVGQGVVLDVAGAIAQRLELGQALGRLTTAFGEADLQLGKRVLQIGVGECCVDIVLEVMGGGFHQRLPGSGSPIDAWSPMPASTSAT
jgi:hypothetical protein